MLKFVMKTYVDSAPTRLTFDTGYSCLWDRSHCFRFVYAFSFLSSMPARDGQTGGRTGKTRIAACLG